MGKRLHRELQRPHARRATRRRDVLHAGRGPHHHRAMAPPLHHDQAAQRPQLQTTGAGKHRFNGPKTDDALTITLDHSVGAHQRRGQF